MAPKFYDILGISENATKEEIKKAYKTKAVQCHPDKGGDSEEFKQVSLAYSVLHDDEKRKRYDMVGDAGWEAGGSNDGHGGGGGGFNQNAMFEEMFRNMGGFGGFGGMGMHSQHTHTQRSHRKHGIHISLRESYTGLTKQLKIILQKPCTKCRTQCGSCQGRGSVQEMVRHGFMTMINTRPCAPCSGSGSINSGCSVCDKKGHKVEEHLLNIVIPRGVENGFTIKFAGFGEQATTDSETSGDLLVEIAVDGGDTNFIRTGNDIIYEHKITLRETFTGKQITIPHYEKDIVVNTADFGIVQGGKKYIMQDKGMPYANGRFGNLILMFSVSYPSSKHLTLKERGEIQTLFERLKI